jgi:hypothetical protein
MDFGVPLGDVVGAQEKRATLIARAWKVID